MTYIVTECIADIIYQTLTCKLLNHHFSLRSGLAEAKSGQWIERTAMFTNTLDIFLLMSIIHRLYDDHFPLHSQCSSSLIQAIVVSLLRAFVF